jgi:hypothetical protein
LLQNWNERIADLSPFAGQTVRIAFTKTGSGLYVHLDNVRITDEAVKPIAVTLGVGEIVADINFGNWVPPLGEIHGYKWHDVNGNGEWEQPDEPPLAGTIVYLDANANGALEYDEVWTTTAADGSYSFTDLPTGEYIVGEVIPEGWSQTSPGVAVLTGPERLFAVRAAAAGLTIYEHDPTTGALVNSFAAPQNGTPGNQGLALGPRSLFYIEGNSTSSPHTLWELDPDTGAVIDFDVVDGAPTTGPISSLGYLNGKVYIYRGFELPTLVWDPVTDSVTTLSIPSLGLLGLTGAEDLGVLFGVNSNGTIYKIDPNSGGVLASWSGSGTSVGLAYVNGELIAVRSGSSGLANRINPSTGAVLGTITLAGTGTMSALAGDGANTLPIQGAHVITLDAHEIVTDVNFGNWIEPPAELHGFKWNDLDGDGTWDKPDEPALQGWLIYLDANANGVLDNGERWTTTAADGSYSFTDLPAGEYIVAELMQPGWTQSSPNATHPDLERLFETRSNSGTIYELDPATGGAIRSIPAPVPYNSPNQALAVGPRSVFFIDGNGTGTHTLYELNPDTGTVIDADIVDTSLAGIIDGLAYLNGKVFVQKPTHDRILVWDPISDTLVTTLVVAADLSGGLTGAADLGVLYATRSNGSIFAIHPESGAILATLMSGIIAPTGLAYVNGELISARANSIGPAYRINPLTGQVLGTFPSGGPGFTGALGADGVTSVSSGVHIVELVPGQSLQNVNFGNWIAGPAEIHGAKWNDLDQDGVWDRPDEPGLAGWTIFLDANGNGVLNDGEVSTVTGEDGSYSFTGLAPGVYAVREVLQSGWAQTYAIPFVSLDLGERATGVNFGNRALPGSISGYKWNDLDGDSVKDINEPTLFNWLIFLDENGNGVRDEGERATHTDHLIGAYSFLQVPVGTYVVAEEQQPGWAATFTPPPVVIGPGQSVTNVNFGNKALPGSIRGQKWHDLDGDGAKEEGEPGLAGWTIFIDENRNELLDSEEQWTTTNENGNYEFTGLAPGEYRVMELPLAGWQSSQPETFVIDRLRTELAVTHATIANRVPNGYDFSEGDSGDRIIDGGNNMYESGNFLNTNHGSSIPYTSGALSSVAWFGEDSQYFTAKYPGLFVLAVDNASIIHFETSGNTGTNGAGMADRSVLSITADGKPYTIFLRRVYGAGTPSINHLYIVPGDGAGIEHYSAESTFEDVHGLNHLESVDRFFYVLVSTNAGQLQNDDVLTIARAFLNNVSAAIVEGAAEVSIGPGQNVENVDFGNFQVPLSAGDYNRDSSVDAADYVFWRKFLGATVSPPYAGADGDGSAIVDSVDEAVWTSQFGAPPPPPGDSPAASAEQPPLQVFAAFSMEPAADDQAAARAASVSGDATNGTAPGSGVRNHGFDTFQPRARSSWSARARESLQTGRAEHNQLDAAIKMWLLDLPEQVDSDEAADLRVGGRDSARDAYFDSLDATLTDFVASRGAGRLVALR